MDGERRGGVRKPMKHGQVCPKCGSSELAPFLYGMPAWSPGLEADIDAGRLVVGGCMIHDDPPQPTHRCRRCGTDFRLAPDLSEPRDRSDGATLSGRLHALAAFLPVFEQADFEFGTWEGGEEVDGVIQMPYYSFSPEADRFLSMAYEYEWVTPFDWGAWAETPEGRRMLDGGDTIRAATPEDLARVLTAIIRAERFGDGQLEQAFRSGLLVAIVRRAAALVAQEPPSSR